MNAKNLKLKIYTTSWCPDCRVAKRFLNEHNIDYEEIDIDKDSDAEAFVIKASGGRRVIPTIDADGKCLFNPPLIELAKVLGIQ
ncbi:MAG: glutaredoxin family protein [Bacteroidetes bacterium]|nr:glutaredoxin family protein [Bacteroidota bacterium]